MKRINRDYARPDRHRTRTIAITTLAKASIAPFAPVAYQLRQKLGHPFPQPPLRQPPLRHPP
ncbi:MAG TPA: hypothetical protein VKB78_13615, partial [Pirellulales bacterium]|nr:hypothetical protein [Pirellulales bacterium]